MFLLYTQLVLALLFSIFKPYRRFSAKALSSTQNVVSKFLLLILSTVEYYTNYTNLLVSMFLVKVLGAFYNAGKFADSFWFAQQKAFGF